MVVVDYFTKWVEVEALTNIREIDFKKFFWKNIVMRFGILESLVSNNDLQFDSKVFCKYYGDLSIKIRYSTPAYPQINGQVEATNKATVNGLKKRLEGTKGRWTNEFPNMLWAYQTTLQRSTGKTPYSLTYEMEAVIPTEISLSSTRTSDFSPDTNNELMVKQLDSLEEH